MATSVTIFVMGVIHLLLVCDSGLIQATTVSSPETTTPTSSTANTTSTTTKTASASPTTTITSTKTSASISANRTTSPATPASPTITTATIISAGSSTSNTTSVTSQTTDKSSSVSLTTNDGNVTTANTTTANPQDTTPGPPMVVTPSALAQSEKEKQLGYSIVILLAVSVIVIGLVAGLTVVLNNRRMAKNKNPKDGGIEERHSGIEERHSGIEERDQGQVNIAFSPDVEMQNLT